jgi:hypothetical protein
LVHGWSLSRCFAAGRNICLFGEETPMNAIHSTSRHILHAHVKERSSDDHEGRLTGIPGHNIAASWREITAKMRNS